MRARALAPLLLLLYLAPCAHESSTPSAASLATIRADGAAYSVVWIDLNRAALDLHWKRPDGTRYGGLAAVCREVERAGQRTILATNAGIFDPSFAPCGLHIEAGRQLVPLNTAEGDGNFYLKPTGVFLIDDSGPAILETTEYRDRPASPLPRLATQSGPLLLRRGVIHPAFRADSTNRKVRSAIGVASRNRIAVVLSDEPVTFHALACLFRDELGCADALYLDGSISNLYAPQWGKADDGDFAGMLVVRTAE